MFCNLLGQIEFSLMYCLWSFTLSSKYAAGLDLVLVNCGHRLCDLNQENLFLEILETGKFLIRVSAWKVLVKACCILTQLERARDLL